MTRISDDKCERTLTCLATLATDNIYTEVGDKSPTRQDLHAKIPDSAHPPGRLEGCTRAMRFYEPKAEHSRDQLGLYSESMARASLALSRQDFWGQPQ